MNFESKPICILNTACRFLFNKHRSISNHINLNYFQINQMNIKYYLFKAIQVANWAFMYCWDHKLTDQKNSHKIVTSWPLRVIQLEMGVFPFCKKKPQICVFTQARLFLTFCKEAKRQSLMILIRTKVIFF